MSARRTLVSAVSKFDMSLLDLLACPVTGSKLKYDSEANQLYCKDHIFDIDDHGIPVLLPPIPTTDFDLENEDMSPTNTNDNK